MNNKTNRRLIIDFSRSKLFNFITEFDLGDIVVDLHNDYVCQAVEFDGDGSIFKMKFTDHSKSQNVVVEFREAVLKKISLAFLNNSEDRVLNNIYRGRFVEDNAVVEFSKSMQVYFYLEFNNGSVFEVLCSKATLDFGSSE